MERWQARAPKEPYAPWLASLGIAALVMDNIGQGYRKIPGLEDKDYSEYGGVFSNAKSRNGQEYLHLQKK